MATKLNLTEIENAVDAALVISKLDTNAALEVKNNIFKQLRAVAEEELNEEDEKEPRSKSQYVILVSDPNKLITSDLVGWVLNIPEETPIQTTKDLLHKSFYNFNTTKKGIKHPVTSIGEGLQNVPGTAFKEVGIKIKTKTPVLVITTDNVLPKDNSSKV